jgi:hypothetical protein
MAYYRKNKRRFDPRYFMNERMEEELEERVSTDPSTVGSSNIMNLPSAKEEEEEEEEEEEDPIGAAEETPGYGVEEGCGDDVDVEVEEEPGFSFTGDVGDLGGDEAFGVGWNAALGEISSIVRELMAEMGTEEDEDADPVGDVAGEALPQMVGEPHLEE